jgi:hypothetical protein
MLLRALRNARLRSAAVRLGFYVTNTGFTVVGVAFAAVLVFGFLRPQAEQSSARDWVQVPCTVISSSMRGKGNSYETVFAYSYGGMDYTSNRANFYATTTNTRYGKGYALNGWLDPAHPERFVQDLHFTPPWYFVVLLFVAATVPLLVVVRGIHGMATLSPIYLRYLGEKPDDAATPA